MRRSRTFARVVGLCVALVAQVACAGSGVPPMAPRHHGGGDGSARRALVLHGSRAGSTAEVADFIGERLAAAGWSVDVESAGATVDLGRYQAVVIGSAIRRGAVLPEVRDFVKAHRAELRGVPVAYFTLGAALREDTPEHRARADASLDPLRAEVPPVAVGLFAGKMDYGKLDGISRTMVKMRRIPEGDWRDWSAIAAWAEALAASLAAPPAASGPM